MNKLIALLLLPFITSAFAPIQNTEGYQVQMDLTNIVEDKIKVTMVVPILEQESTVFTMPKIIPGTYKVYDYGQFVHDFKAYNSQGEELSVETLNVNQWQIGNAKELYKIEYWASASYNNPKSKIFAPGGTGISEEAFMLNNFGFIGYLDNHDKRAYQLHIKKPVEMYGVTSLQNLKRMDSLDLFTAANYFEVHDCPILYAAPDTASMVVAGIPIMIGAYSKEKNVDATKIRDGLKDLFKAAAAYFNGNLPAEKYTILIYGLEPRVAIRNTGALEHHTSTLLTVPDANDQVMRMFFEGEPMQLYRDIVAHEFFHIVTPLNIHSKQINEFDFISPQMSEHLWFYEGVTEYNSMISQARGGILTLQQFVDETKSKIKWAKRYNQYVPFTQLSKHALDVYENQYGNVYMKGALIGMTLDLKLRVLSEGEMGLNDLLEKLWNVYGADTFFVDDDFFSIIAENSFAEIETFLVKHVASAEPLPLKDLFAEVGITYIESRESEEISFGNISFSPVKDKDLVRVTRFDDDNPFIKDLGIQKGDYIKSWNGQKVNKHTAYAVASEAKKTTQVGDKITVVVVRENKKGKSVEVELKAKAIKTVQVESDVLFINENLTDKQRNLRHIWINQ